MSEQVTLETYYDSVIAAMPPERLGARLYQAGLTEGLTFGATHHGAPDLWDWGRAMHSLLTAQDRERQADKLVAAMTPAQRAMLWLDGHPEREALRLAARRLA